MSTKNKKSDLSGKNQETINLIEGLILEWD